MIINIKHEGETKTDRNVTQYHYNQYPTKETLEVTYNDGSTAEYDEAQVKDAWQDEETHKEY